MTNRRRSLRALVLTLGAVWAITSCGLIDGFLDEGEDKNEQQTASLAPRSSTAAAGPYAPGAGGSAMASTAGRGGGGGAAGSASISSAGSGELSPPPVGLNSGAPAGQAKNNNQLKCD